MVHTCTLLDSSVFSVVFEIVLAFSFLSSYVLEF